MKQELPVSVPNWANRTIFTGDNLEVLRRMNEGSVDLVYLDPPFNSRKPWAAPIGSRAAGAHFKDTWTLADIDLEWHDQLEALNPALHDVIRAGRGSGGDGTMSYLLYMSVRLMELWRVLKPSGSLVLHCDQTESHGLKWMLDTIFGRQRFRNEIAWCYTGPSNPNTNQFPRKHDTLFWYSKTGDYTFNKDQVRVGYEKSTVERGKYDSASPTTGSGFRDTSRGKIPESWWADIPAGGQISRKELVGYPTQKPRKLLERIVAAISNPDDMVLDAFCGCATTPVAAEALGRQWVGIDLSEKALELVKYRLREQLLLEADVTHRIADPEHPRFVGHLERTDLGDLPHYKTHKTALYVEQDGHCNLCGEWFAQGNLSVDHIIPRKHGGTDHRQNLQLLCRACNSKKGDRNWETVKADYFRGRRRQ